MVSLSTAYHVVTDRPMHLGQHILFDASHRSGVWQRVNDRTAEVAAVHAAPAAYQGVELEHHLAVALRERALEEVRSSQFAELPSRLASLYVSATQEDAERWCALFVEQGRPTFHIVRLEIEGRQFAGDARNCFTGTPDQAENLRLAQHYWRNVPNPEGTEPITEILVDGHIRVAEIVQEIRENLPVELASDWTGPR